MLHTYSKLVITEYSFCEHVKTYIFMTGFTVFSGYSW